MRGHRYLLGATLLATLATGVTSPATYAAAASARPAAAQPASSYALPEVGDEVLLRAPGFFKSVGGLGSETE